MWSFTSGSYRGRVPRIPRQPDAVPPYGDVVGRRGVLREHHDVGAVRCLDVVVGGRAEIDDLGDGALPGTAVAARLLHADVDLLGSYGHFQRAAGRDVPP